MTISLDLSAVRDGHRLTVRPATVADSARVLELMNTCEKHDIGEALLDEDDIVGDWQRPSFDLSTQSIIVSEGERLVAYGEVFKGRRADAHVLPSERGRGIGTALMRWTWDVCQAYGGSLVGQPVLAHSDAAVLLAAHGYQPLWSSWILALPPGARMTASPLPAGTTMREFRPGVDDRATFEVIENAFAEWENRGPSQFEDWAASSVLRPGFEPWHLQLAVETAQDGSESVVGAVHVLPADGDAWISEVATRRDRRGRGLGRALLVRAHEVAREHGAVGCGLSTDSRTGALGLYEHVGMQVTQTFVHYAREV